MLTTDCWLAKIIINIQWPIIIIIELWARNTQPLSCAYYLIVINKLRSSSSSAWILWIKFVFSIYWVCVATLCVGRNSTVHKSKQNVLAWARGRSWIISIESDKWKCWNGSYRWSGALRFMLFTLVDWIGSFTKLLNWRANFLYWFDHSMNIESSI